MDEGRLTDSLGRVVNFKNAILIMTSNVGTRQLKEFGKGVGFNISGDSISGVQSKNVIQKALTKIFAPEFLNRIDDVIYFDQLNKESLLKIIDLELESLLKRVESLGFILDITPDAKSFISDKGYDIQFGARPLKRAIQKYLEDEMAELILSGTLKNGDRIEISLDNEKERIVKKVNGIAV
jgi:ATP-dependent Clp protease ATP-binding subunit ClpC